MKRDVKWTHELRKLVFSRLASELGKDYRSQGLFREETKRREKEIVAEMARHLTQVTGKSFATGAVQNQVEWALNDPSSVKKSMVTVYCQCKVAAHEAGLIGRLSARTVTLHTGE